MYNAINRLAINKLVGKLVLAALAGASLALGACADKERRGAEELASQCREAIEARNFSGAMVILDTLNSRYPQQVEVRRNALRLRAQAMEGMAQDSIAAGDAALANATMLVDGLKAGFRHVDSSVGLEGYYLPVGTSDKVMTATGIQGRVSDKGHFYIVANVQGKAIGLNAIDFRDGAESIGSSEISPARVIRVEGSESASFNPEDLNGVGQWLVAHPGASKIVLCGTRGKAEVKLDKKLYKELTDCYNYGTALQALYVATVKREKYERMLSTARDQLANMPADEKK